MRLERSFSFGESGARAHAWLLTTNVAHTHTTYHVNPTIKWCHPQNLHVSYFSRHFLNKKNLYVGDSLVICQSRAAIFFELTSHGLVDTIWPHIRSCQVPALWFKASALVSKLWSLLAGGKGKGCDVGDVGLWVIFGCQKSNGGEKTCLVARKRYLGGWIDSKYSG